MSAFRRVGWLCLALVCACGPGSDSGPDAGDVDGDAMGTDGGSSGALCFRFRSKPEVPDSVGGIFDAQIDAAEMTLSDFRAIGDAAPGDERTTLSYLQLNFASGDQTRCFPQAPPGVYSHLTATVSHYKIDGSAVVDSEREAFVIEDSQPIDILIDLEGGVVHEDDTLVDVEVELGDIVLSVDWSDVEGDPMTVNAQSSQIGAVRAAVGDALESEQDQSD